MGCGELWRIMRCWRRGDENAVMWNHDGRRTTERTCSTSSSTSSVTISDRQHLICTDDTLWPLQAMSAMWRRGDAGIYWRSSTDFLLLPVETSLIFQLRFRETIRVTISVYQLFLITCLVRLCYFDYSHDKRFT